MSTGIFPDADSLTVIIRHSMEDESTETLPLESRMVTAHPHYLLFCDTHVDAERSYYARSAATANTLEDDPSTDKLDSAGKDRTPRVGGKWHFILEQLDDSQTRLEVADREASANPERLALLGVVRGLEALEQPSKVTLVTTSRYVSRGLRYGLSSWRDSDYTWERFGVRMPIRNADLWQRVDAALQFHGVTCRLIQSPAASTPDHDTRGLADSVEWDNPRAKHSSNAPPSKLGHTNYGQANHLRETVREIAKVGSSREGLSPRAAHGQRQDSAGALDASGQYAGVQHASGGDGCGLDGRGLDDRELLNAELMCVEAVTSIADDLASIDLMRGDDWQEDKLEVPAPTQLRVFDGGLRASNGDADGPFVDGPDVDEFDREELALQVSYAVHAPSQNGIAEKNSVRFIASTKPDSEAEHRSHSRPSYFATTCSETLHGRLGDSPDRWWEMAITWIRWWRGRLPTRAYPMGA